MVQNIIKLGVKSGTYKGMKYCSEINQGQEKVHVEESKVSMEL